MPRLIALWLLAFVGLLGQPALEARFVVTGEGASCDACLHAASGEASALAPAAPDCRSCCVEASRPSSDVLSGWSSLLADQPAVGAREAESFSSTLATWLRPSEPIGSARSESVGVTPGRGPPASA